MKQLHINQNLVKAGIGACLIALVAIGGVAYSKKSVAEETLSQPDNSARVEITDVNGVRVCEIYPGDGSSKVEQLEAYAKQAGCNIKSWVKRVLPKHVDTPVASDAVQATEVQQSAPAIVAPKAPTLSVAPVNPAQIAATK
jgi:hypothetical protein